MKRKQTQDWRKLVAGDLIRIVAIPVGDQRDLARTGDDSTVRVLSRLMSKRSTVKIARIDSYGYPWFNYRCRDKRGRMEYHSLIILDNDSWVRVRPRQGIKT
ncbi:MAG TPA: hypothetical protein VEK08_25790 [Planctomycetota bacterium]|nr:hypothetical protein [Planctomycetota bacterium]